MGKKRFLVGLLVIFLSFFGSKFVLDRLYASQRDLNFGNDKNYNDNAISKEEGEYLILLVGVDKNSDDQVNTDFTRTDTIMLISANSKTGEMHLLSIPRDSRVKIREKFDKVNHAHAFGGIELTMQTLRTFLGLDIDYYVQINYQALMNIVDALGGVDYEVPEGIEINKGKVQIKPGLNHLDGNEVMWYLRTRNIYNNGDIGRVNTQQAFVKAMVDEMVKKSKDINIMTFISNYLKYVKTNLPLDAMMDLAGHINKFSSDKMQTHTVPGMEKNIGGVSYWIPDYEKTWSIVDDNYKNFKLKNWQKEDSGFYEEYGSFGEIKDQSKSGGIINNQNPANTNYVLPKTQSLPTYQYEYENNESNNNYYYEENTQTEEAPTENGSTSESTGQGENNENTGSENTEAPNENVDTGQEEGSDE